MTASLFTRVFSYRQRENNSPLENYLTEIFAYCIESDFKFRSDFFFNCLDIHAKSVDIKIQTQDEYEGYGRPDIEINFDNTSILFECKVEASERENQLEDYAAILKKYKPSGHSKHIVFLTKYFEHKELADTNINLHLIRWFAVYELIDDTHSQITNQLKIFLKDYDMEKIKNFTIQDLLAMKTIPETMTKMDELLEQFKPECDKQFGGFSKDSSRSTRLPNSLYINYVQLSFDKSVYHLLIGFFWWWGEIEVPVIGLSLEIPVKKFENSELLKILDKELVETRDWQLEEDGKFYFYSSFKPLTDFITAEEDNMPAMKKFLQSQLNVMYDLRKTYPKLFKK
jgi:hypothetical protein